MAKTAADMLLRHWTLLRKIPRHPQTRTARALHQTLADEGYHVTLRTVERDLDALSRAFPITCDDGPVYEWCWLQDAPMPDIPGMEPAMALAFGLVQQYLTPLLPSATLGLLGPYFEQAARVLDKRRPLAACPVAQASASDHARAALAAGQGKQGSTGHGLPGDCANGGSRRTSVSPISPMAG